MEANPQTRLLHAKQVANKLAGYKEKQFSEHVNCRSSDYVMKGGANARRAV
jgi:hypothetical protein